jgi:4,5-DOPA dioxygenase extradiol
LVASFFSREVFMLPSLFISHGSPMLALEDAPTTHFMRSVGQSMPRPKAILVASAHWETERPMLSSAEHPETLHDFGGFAKELYELRYWAPGSPMLALQAQGLLQKAGIGASLDPSRGFDHGAWNPLLLMYPEADIPVVELSVQPQRDARWHYALGQALASLKDQGVLIMGTGNLTHNLYEAFRGGHVETPAWVDAFSSWVFERLSEGDLDALLNWWTRAPYAQRNHPSPEHFLPFFVALGAAGAQAKAQRLHHDVTMGVLAMDAYAFMQMPAS